MRPTGVHGRSRETGEADGKGTAPKERMFSRTCAPGHTVNNCVTVILQTRWRATKRKSWADIFVMSALFVPILLLFIIRITLRGGIDMEIFRGAGVALVTPFHENGEINYNKLGELVEEQVAGHTDAIIAMGTTGEAATTTEQEHMDVIRFICQQVNGRIPVIAGTGSNCTKTAIELSREAESVGADGVLLVSPYYNKATQEGLKRHFKAIADSIRIPAILYNVPSRTGINIAPATIAELCRDVDNIVGVKEASGNFSAVAELMNLTDGNIDVYSGNDDQIVPMLSLGGKGVISVLSNIAPRETHDICELFFNGDIEGSRQLQIRALPLIKALFCEVNPIPVRAALNLMGKEIGEPRLPLTVMEAAHQEMLKREMVKFGLLP